MAVGIEEVLFPKSKLSGRAFTDEDRGAVCSSYGVLSKVWPICSSTARWCSTPLENLHESVIPNREWVQYGSNLGVPITDLALRDAKRHREHGSGSHPELFCPQSDRCLDEVEHHRHP